MKTQYEKFSRQPLKSAWQHSLTVPKDHTQLKCDYGIFLQRKNPCITCKTEQHQKSAEIWESSILFRCVGAIHCAERLWSVQPPGNRQLAPHSRHQQAHSSYQRALWRNCLLSHSNGKSIAFNWWQIRGSIVWPTVVVRRFHTKWLFADCVQQLITYLYIFTCE